MNDELIEELGTFTHDPLGFVYFAFPWGEPGSELESDSGPEPWQIDILTKLRDKLVSLSGAVRLATVSGHGIGKSAIVSWLILWGMGTFPDTMGVVTANTEPQLRTKTWAQLSKWYRLFIGRDMFHMTATRLYSVDPEHERTWSLDMVPWSEHRPEAFAGMHNKGKRIIMLFDEASAIPDVIWEVTEGALTDSGTEIIWGVFGNPTKNSGRFFECFHRHKHRWITTQVDSRTVSFTDKKLFTEQIEDYGIDSDFVRVRIRGVFPRMDAEGFISYEIAMEATQREISPQHAPVVLGVDPARFGNDASIIYPRCGRDGITRPIEVYFGIDTMALAAKVSDAMFRHNAVMAFVDEGGLGAGVVDRLRQLQVPVYGVDFSSSPDGDMNDGTKYKNKRAEIWGRMRQWLKGGAIPERVKGIDESLPEELSGPSVGLDAQEKLQLESKKDMRKRGKPSPNVADALATTFAYEVWLPAPGEKPAATVTPEYDPFVTERIYA